jgi:regulator of cell morphogenesis and NO signaling
MAIEIANRKITDIVEDNYVFAYVLYYFGIQFYEYSENTLAQVCRQKGLGMDNVVKSLEEVQKAAPVDLVPLEELPIDLIIEYLKHTHYIFIKQKLPYMVRLIDTLTFTTASASLVKDLQMVFPLFVEDFIRHIYEEEDTLFTYIHLLHQAKTQTVNRSRLYYQMEKHSLQTYAMDHDTHDDEMQGIRNITNQYNLDDNASLHLKVIFAELKAFEQALQTHASIENEILFPKALRLEREVKMMLSQLVKLN